MERYPPHRILLILMWIAIPLVLYFYLFPEEFRNSGFLSDTTVSPALVNAVPEIAGRTRKGADLPVTVDRPPADHDFFSSLNPPVTPLEYPWDTAALNRFFIAIRGAMNEGAPLRILHLGDSQLEEDRISRYLRQRFELLLMRGSNSGKFELLNVPKRGSAGIDLSEMLSLPASAFLQQFKPDLIIFQFGINVVRASTRDFGYYTRALNRQIDRFRVYDPEIPVLLVSVSDMARREADRLISYETVPLIRNAQRQAAMQNQCAFWDLLEFMGGEGSASHWYLTDPPLLREDLTHFSFGGGLKLADGLFEAIIWDYGKWIETAR